MRRHEIIIIGLLGLFYLVTHLASLDLLPVFADEGIYIRWAQIIIDDPGRYLFFALNDGKTPLFIWLMVPLLKYLGDPLIAGRLASVLVGLLQLPLFYLILKELKVSQKIAYLGTLLVTILPFWYFHHRLALMDGLLTLGMSLALWGAIKASRGKFQLKTAAIVGLGLGLALWSKLPALLATPTLFAPVIFKHLNHLKKSIPGLKTVALGTVIGLILFLTLALQPAFGQLFNRGGDFLYPFSEVFLNGLWQETLPNVPTYINYFIAYLTPSLMVLALAGLFLSYQRERTHALFWSGVIFCAPIALLGKVVYPRYLFPAAIYFTLAAVVSLDALYRSWFDEQQASRAKEIKTKLLVGVITALLLANTVASSLSFMIYSLTDVEKMPLVAADTSQYLTSWSSGHGLKETAAMIKDEARSNSLAVATEGYFGTLPDGLLMYFHDDYPNVAIDGIGQPVSGIPSEFLENAARYDKIWLVVNSHRLNLSLPHQNKIYEHCRPLNAPCLQVWDITEIEL